MADALDSKSSEVHPSCGFNSHLRHQLENTRMKAQAPRLMTALATLTMLWSAIAQATTPVDIIRVYAIAPDSFDYVFTSVVSSSDEDPVLSRVSFVSISARRFSR